MQFVPYKVFHYRSPVDSVASILSKPGMEEACLNWKTRNAASEEKSDIYDGLVWQRFQKYNGKDFLISPNNYAILINVDWFQPFERRCDVSIGAFYGVLMNLPRNIRFKRENVLLIGIIPALDKEPKSLSSFLQPFVKDMKTFWKGVRVKTNINKDGVVVRVAVLCAAADIPAARKLCGFMGHCAAYGCSKCMKKFPGGFGEKRNYSGFHKQSWPKRTKSLHSKYVDLIQRTQTKTARKQLESKYGCRYSVLMDLTYFDVIEHHVIDPMHNLFLGTANKCLRHGLK